MSSTLVSTLKVERPDSHVRVRDVPTTVEVGGAWADIVLTQPTLTVSIRLSGAERIALIEALGGKA